MMNDKEIIVNYNVDIVAYSAAVQDIAKKFFDEDGNYTPHFGRANAVGVFFNYFVDDVSLAAYFSDVDGDLDLDFLLNNEDCMKAYNDALTKTDYYRLDFANAYEDAMEIVRVKSSTLVGAVGQFRDIVVHAIEKISPVFTEDNIEKLTRISEEVSSGNLSADSIVAAFGNSLKQQ